MVVIISLATCKYVCAEIVVDKRKKHTERRLKGHIASVAHVTNRPDDQERRGSEPSAVSAVPAGLCDGLPVYLLHGLLGTAAVHFGRQLEGWRTQRPVRGIDLPGHGRAVADARRPYWAAATALVAGAMAKGGPGHLMGASYLGGTVAVRVSLDRPDLVRSLVLSGFVPDVPQQAITAWVGGFARLAERNPDLAAEYERLHGARWQNTLRVITEEITVDYPGSARVTTAMLEELPMPALVVNGNLRSDERGVATALPSRPGRLEASIVPGAGHMVQYEAADAFNAIVSGFWSRISRDAGPEDGTERRERPVAETAHASR